jgi:hypothetical protein
MSLADGENKDIDALLVEREMLMNQPIVKMEGINAVLGRNIGVVNLHKSSIRKKTVKNKAKPLV